MEVTSTAFQKKTNVPSAAQQTKFRKVMHVHPLGRTPNPTKTCTTPWRAKNAARQERKGVQNTATSAEKMKKHYKTQVTVGTHTHSALKERHGRTNQLTNRPDKVILGQETVSLRVLQQAPGYISGHHTGLKGWETPQRCP